MPEGSESVYVINSVGSDGLVNMHLEGTNLERFRVDPATLKFIETVPRDSRPANTSAKRTVNVEEIRERLSTIQHSSIDQLSGEIAILKKYLKSGGVRPDAIEELDSLCKALEDRWKAALERISKALGE